MKKLLLTAVIAGISTMSLAQLKVESTGSVGIGTLNAYPSYSCTVKQKNYRSGNGSIYIESHDQNHGVHVGIYPANAHFGATNGNIALYSWNYGYNRCTAAAYYTNSDRSLKTEIKDINNALDLIMKFRSVSYKYKSDIEKGNAKTTFGFIAQEVAEFLPEMTAEQMELLSLDYTQVIPLLVTGMQEQQAQIDSKDEMIASLDQEIKDLKNLIFKFADMAGVDISEEGERPAAVLYQNKPNPFRDQTVINYELPENCTSASIMIFDMTGEMIETYSVSPRDGGMLTIEGKAFKPGMYLYSLIVDDVEIDTKRMILSK